jgi:hypothetical protein
MSERTKYRPVVILGAGRSGTNILRDCLTDLPDFATWPCDEIQPIWRFRNRKHKSDSLPIDLARPTVVRFINKAFDAIWKRSNRPEFVVEKTCANTLRVPFVDAVLDDAFYIHLVRHGSDVVPSAAKRWRGELEVPSIAYFAAKARYIPLGDAPSYLYDFVAKRVGKHVGKRKFLSSWGPRFDGIDDFPRGDLDVLCAKQWAECVSQTRLALSGIDPDRTITVYYEDFLTNPAAELKRITCALEKRYPEKLLSQAVSKVRQKNKDKMGSVIESEQVKNILSPVLTEIGYGVRT